MSAAYVPSAGRRSNQNPFQKKSHDFKREHCRNRRHAFGIFTMHSNVCRLGVTRDGSRIG
jgi:hypothetical protein